MSIYYVTTYKRSYQLTPLIAQYDYRVSGDGVKGMTKFIVNKFAAER